MSARRGLVIDTDLAKADPGCKALEEAVALGQLPQRGRCARRQQAEVAGIFGDLLPRAPIDQCIEAAHRLPSQERFIVAMRLRGIDDVVAVIDPVLDQLLDQVGRMLAVAIHEQHGAAAGMVEAGDERGLLAEIA